MTLIEDTVVVVEGVEGDVAAVISSLGVDAVVAVCIIPAEKDVVGCCVVGVDVVNKSFDGVDDAGEDIAVVVGVVDEDVGDVAGDVAGSADAEVNIDVVDDSVVDVEDADKDSVDPDDVSSFTDPVDGDDVVGADAAELATTAAVVDGVGDDAFGANVAVDRYSDSVVGSDVVVAGLFVADGVDVGCVVKVAVEEDVVDIGVNVDGIKVVVVDTEEYAFIVGILLFPITIITFFRQCDFLCL